jgi:Zn-dependent protease
VSRTVPGVYAGTLFGFPLFIESSALYLGPWVALILLTQGGGSDLIRAFLFLIIIIASVLVHELTHALTARALGVPVRHIALTWFGGYAAFWVQPTRWKDAAIAFAGPASNLSLAALLYMALANMPVQQTVWVDGSDLVVAANAPNLLEHTLRTAAFLNVALGAYNLLPGLPLDGGHILRALLATRMPWGRAGWFAAWAGVVLGAAAVAYAIWIESFSLLFMGAFVTFSAWAARRALRYE